MVYTGLLIQNTLCRGLYKGGTLQHSFHRRRNNEKPNPSVRVSAAPCTVDVRLANILAGDAKRDGGVSLPPTYAVFPGNESDCPLLPQCVIDQSSERAPVELVCCFSGAKIEGLAKSSVSAGPLRSPQSRLHGGM